MKNATHEELASATALVESYASELEEARGYGCTELVALLEPRVREMRGALERAATVKERLHLAHSARRDALQALEQARAVGPSLDREAVLRRRDDIEYAFSVVQVRELELNAARSHAESPLGPVTRHRSNAYRSGAEAEIASMLEFMLTRSGTPPQSAAAKLHPEQAAWEAFYVERALARVAKRAHHVLQFTDAKGLARAIEHVRSGFASRAEERRSRLEDTAEKKDAKARETAAARRATHGIDEIEARAAAVRETMESADAQPAQPE